MDTDGGDPDSGLGDAGVGAGGKTGSGGASSGGKTGSGGASSGGKTGSGGASSGGKTGSGGASSGGKTGSGGASSGGKTGSGGASSGGKTGSGGASSGDACDDLAECCKTTDPIFRANCNQLATGANVPACQAAEGFFCMPTPDGGTTPDGGSACSTLEDCCASVPIAQRQNCKDTATSGVEFACTLFSQLFSCP